METIIYKADEILKNQRLLDEVSDIIKQGGLLGIPTETVYGLGANGLDEEAVKKIFEVKGRAQDNPLILHVYDVSWLERYCTDIPDEAITLADKFWPGPLTFILQSKSCVPQRTRANLKTVGVRCPDNAVTREIIKNADVPIAAPSANTSGRPSCTTAESVIEDIGGKIQGIIKDGGSEIGVESTIIDLTSTPPRLLRPGGLPMEALTSIIGHIDVDPTIVRTLNANEKPIAPGMKYRHYAPKASVTVVMGNPDLTAAYIVREKTESDGIICFSEYLSMFEENECQSLGEFNDRKTHAANVFSALRYFDQYGSTIQRIFAQCPDEKGLDLAVSNRLKKAAGFHIIEL